MRPRLALRSSPLVALAAAAASVAAPPTAWTWDPPVGPAAADPAFVPLVRTFVSVDATPESVADETRLRIQQLGLTAGRVGVLPLNLGRGLLIGNSADHIDDSSVPAQIRGGTPWTANGRVAMRVWMDRFIERYQFHQSSAGIPAPTRFHLDCELRLPALRYLPDVSDCWGVAPMQLFAAMQSDPRWNTEPLLMNPSGVPASITIADHYSAQGSPPFDPTLPRDDPANRGWSVWWDGMTREAVEGALDESVFSRVRTAWPGLRSSEFAESMRIDGGAEPDGTPRQYVDFEWWDRGWMRSRWCGRAELQAPALYLFGSTFLDSGEDFWRGNMRHHRANLDACLHSFGGVPPSEVTPWVTLPRTPLPAGRVAPDRAVSDDEFLEIMALLRGRGIDEFQLWPGGDVGLWRAAQRGVHAAWKCDLVSAEIIDGNPRPEAPLLVRRADRQTLSLGAVAGGGRLAAVFLTPDAASAPAGGAMWIALECAAGTGGVFLNIEARSISGRWIPVSAIECAATLPGAHWIGPIESDGLVAADGTVELRLSVTPGATAMIDLVQIARAPAPRPATPDIDGDGSVSAPDLAILLSDWATAELRSDLDVDGAVGPADLTILLSGWTG